MAIGRISGPMLFSNLERQGLDLSVDGDLIYFDVNRKRIGINTSVPEYTLHVKGDFGNAANVYVDGNANITSNLSAKVISVTDKYTFPTEDGAKNMVLATDGSGSVNWSSVSGLTIDRKIFNYSIPELPSGSFHDFTLDIGISSIVYGLTVSRPCLVEVFGSVDKKETNPYTFLATLGHLTDDGTVLLNDGSIIQQRQYNIFANQDEPALGKVYGRITNTDGITGKLDFTMTYFVAVTDAITGVYNMNLVNALPAKGYTGQTVVTTFDDTMYVWYNAKWNAVK
jgi:hypothetical protein